MADPARHVDPVHYPESDGKPMGETALHGLAIVDLSHQLRWHLRHARLDHYVGADNLWYYVEGDPHKVVVPDVYVVRGVPWDQPPLRVWQTWVQGVVPGVVFEVTSRSSRDEDLGPKRALYERLGVSELWLFDPLGEYLDPPVRGFVRGPAGFAEVVPAGDRWHSPWLDLHLSIDDTFLALTRGSDPRPPRITEIPQVLDEAAAMRADAEVMQTRIAALEAELAKLRQRS